MRATQEGLLNQVGEKLVRVQQELDELALQLSLGKAEARDKFEELKVEFRDKVAALKLQLHQSEETIRPEVLRTLEGFELQLALGKAETKDRFHEQKIKILHSLNTLEQAWTEWIKTLDSNFFTHEAEKFKLKLEILRLRFDLKAFEMKDAYRGTMPALRRELERIHHRLQQRMKSGSARYDDFADELSLAYKHLKKAVTDLV
jgi:hypothetical protein